MIDIFVALALFSIGFFVGWKSRERAATRAIDAHFKTRQVDSLTLDVQREGDAFLIWDDSTGQYLTQVKSEQELLEYLSRKFPNRDVLMKNTQATIFENP